MQLLSMRLYDQKIHRLPRKAWYYGRGQRAAGPGTCLANCMDDNGALSERLARWKISAHRVAPINWRHTVYMPKALKWRRLDAYRRA